MSKAKRYRIGGYVKRERHGIYVEIFEEGIGRNYAYFRCGRRKFRTIRRWHRRRNCVLDETKAVVGVDLPGVISL